MKIVLLGQSYPDKDYIHKQLFDYFDYQNMVFPDINFDCGLDQIISLRLAIKVKGNSERNRIMAAHELIVLEDQWVAPNADLWFYLPTNSWVDTEYAQKINWFLGHADVVDLPSERELAADFIREAVEGSQ